MTDTLTELRRVRLARWVLRRYRLPRGKQRLFLTLRGSLALPSRPLVDLDGTLIHADLDEYIQRYVFCNGFDDPDVPILRGLLRRGDVFVDVGANIGLYTLVAAAAVGPSGRVHAFEPLPEAIALLEENVALNDIGNVSIHRVALSDTTSEIEFYLAGNGNLGMGSLSPATWSRPPIRVATRSLDDLRTCGELARCDVLKLDVEGGEPKVLAGMVRLLRDAPPRAVLTEINLPLLALAGSDAEGILGPLRTAGYKFFRASRSGLEPFDAPRRHENIWAMRE